MFPWSRDISMAWVEVRKAAEAHKRNLNIFSSDPWHVFGVSSPTIQARIISGNSKALVKGVLHCDPKTGLSSVDQFKEYLKCEAGDPDWIVEGMMADSIPHYFSQHVSEGAVYWVDARTGASTWSHPHYLKYANLLKQARESKPHADIKSVACFQLSCLLSTVVPPLLSLENVQECARILRVSLQTEPFLAETVKAALRFFQQSLTTVTLSEFQARIERKKKLFSDLSRSVQLRSPDDRGTTTCIECEKEKASIHCTIVMIFSAMIVSQKFMQRALENFLMSIPLLTLNLAMNARTALLYSTVRNVLTLSVRTVSVKSMLAVDEGITYLSFFGNRSTASRNSKVVQ